MLEPGRVLVGNAGILLTRVLYTKEAEKNFVIVDAGMNDLARPAVYDSYHEVMPVVRTRRGGHDGRRGGADLRILGLSWPRIGGSSGSSGAT